MEQQTHQAAPNPAQAGPSAPKNSGRVRRVGTVAFAVTLIVVGVLMLVNAFVPGFDLLEVLKFSPVILIILGIEVLVYSARPGVVLKYDFLSIFVCFVLVVGAAGATVASALMEGYGPTHEYTELRLKKELEQQAHDALSSLETIHDVTVNVTLQRSISSENAQNATITEADDVWAYVTLKNNYDSREAFAADCRRVIDAAEAAGLPFDSYTFDTFWAHSDMPDFSRSYYLTVEGIWSLDRTAEELAVDVDEDIWYAGDCFDGEADLQNYLDEYDQELSDLMPSTAESADAASDNGTDTGVDTGRAPTVTTESA